MPVWRLAWPWCPGVSGARLPGNGSVGWRHIGNSAIELPLPSLATGAVDRVWYSPDGSSLYAKTASGRIFETSDFEQWQLVTDPKVSPPPESKTRLPPELPKLALSWRAAGAAGRLYGVGRDVYRSDDGGESWVNLTAYKGACLLGAGLASVAASPSDPDEVTVASATAYGGRWTGAFPGPG